MWSGCWSTARNTTPGSGKVPGGQRTTSLSGEEIEQKMAQTVEDTGRLAYKNCHQPGVLKHSLV